MSTENNNNTPKENQAPQSEGRRNALKALATIPVLGALGFGVYRKQQYDKKTKSLGSSFHFNKEHYMIPAQPDGKKIRIGMIGFGIRGKQLMRAAGFAEPSWIDGLIEGAKNDSKDKRYEQFLQQDDLNIEVTGVCDIFDVYGEAAVLAASNIHREGSNGTFGKAPKRYRTYQELLAADDIDAVIIATPDHWHSTMAMEAAKAGKHVYVEKPLSWTVPETYKVREVIKETGIIFQLGHQGRQTDSYIRAKEIIDKGLIGKVSLIEVCTNRNDPNGAWVYPLIDGASPETIDWKQFEGPEERIKEYTDYMTSNNLQRYIGPDPHSATSSGGVYYFKDGRTVPDVLQTTFEFPDKDMTMLYSATLASNRPRGKVIMGHDAQMELSNTITLKADPASEIYKEKIDKGIIKPNEPFYTYVPGQSTVDAITSPTELYFAQRGLLYTYVSGKRYDTTHLHIREWLECIRQNKQPSCNIDAAFQEAMTAHMGTHAYLEGRTMYWDKDKEEIVRG